MYLYHSHANSIANAGGYAYTNTHSYQDRHANSHADSCSHGNSDYGSSHGNTQLGGDDFDELLVEYLAERHPGKFRMVAVTVDESWDVVREFFGGPMPPAVAVAIDADQATTRAYYCAARGSCPDSFKFPETYVVDRSGRLVAYMVGPRDWSDPLARKFLEKLIDG